MKPTIQTQRKEIRKVTWIGFISNLLLSGAKCGVGWLSHSQALIADGVHSLSDISSDVVILLGEKFWLAPADESHPYGHRRIETILTATIGIILSLAAIGIAAEALQTMHTHTPDNSVPGWPAFLVALISIGLKEWLFHYTYKAGTRVKSSAVKANAWHHRSDAISSIPVALAVLAAILRPQWAMIDRIGALIVSAFILYSAWRIIKPALEELSDKGACRKTHDKIIALASAVTGVKDVHALRSRRSGPGFFIDLHVLVDPSLSVREGHEIAGIVKHQLLNSESNIDDAIIHIEPYDTTPTSDNSLPT